MKILLGLPEYPPYTIGGGGAVYQNLVKQYQQLGHEVVVIYGYFPTRRWNEKIKITIEKGITYYQVPEIPIPSFLPYLKIRLPCNLHSIRQLNAIINKEKVEIAHLHGYGFIFIDILAYLLQNKHLPYVFTIHGWPQRQKQSNVIVKIIWYLYEKILAKKTLFRAIKVTTVSQFLKSQLPKPIQTKTSVIPNGFDPQKYPANLVGFDIRRRYALPPEEIIFLSLGRIAYLKGLQLVMNKLPELRKKLSLTYLIAGEDEGYKNELLKLRQKLKLESTVKFIGQLDEVTKNYFLSQADVMAIPSLSEGFSLVALEAMYCRKLILYGQSPAVRELIKDYPKKISLVEKNLVSKINQTMRMSTNFDQKKFNWPVIAREYVKVLRDSQIIK